MVVGDLAVFNTNKKISYKKYSNLNELDAGSTCLLGFNKWIFGGRNITIKFFYFIGDFLYFTLVSNYYFGNMCTTCYLYTIFADLSSI